MSSISPQPPDAQPTAQPGKIRTWWHPLLASLLRWQLGSHYHLEEEVPVGQKPLQIDILLLQKEQGELPASARRILAGLVEYLGPLTLLEFKSPSDTLRAGDFQTFLAYALLYRAQNQPLLDPAQLHLLVLAPPLTRPYREELQTLGVTAQPRETGIWRLQGGLALHPTWVLETEALAGLTHPLLTLVSPTFLADPGSAYDLLHQGGYTNLVVYLAQQIQQFRLHREEFAMQHLGTEDELKQVMREILATMSPKERLETLSKKELRQVMREVLATMSPKERLETLSEKELKQVMREVLATMSPEERLKGLSEEDRLRGLTPEDRLRGLSPEELQRLKQLLQTQTKADDTSRPE
jgi:hypothetical protein